MLVAQHDRHDKPIVQSAVRHRNDLSEADTYRCLHCGDELRFLCKHTLTDSTSLNATEFTARTHPQFGRFYHVDGTDCLQSAAMSNAHRAGVELALYKLAELLDHADRITTEQRVGSQQRHIMCDVFSPITGLSRNHADSPQTSTDTTTRTTNKHGDESSYENDRRGSPRPGAVTGGVAIEIFHTCGYLNLKRRFEVLLNHGITTFIMMTESGRNSVSVMQDALTELTTGVETSQGNARDSGAVSVTPGRLYDGGVFDEPQAHISVDTQPSVSGASSAHGGEQSSAGATVEQVGIVGSNVSTPRSQTAATETITIEKPADSHPDTGGESVDDASGDAARNTTNTTATATDEAGTAAMPDETGRPLIAWQLPREFEQSVTLGTPISPGLIDEDNLHALPDTLR